MATEKKQKLHTAAAYSKYTLPKELQFEILCRLPVKPILTLKSVHKSWYDLIRSPYFVGNHLVCSTKSKEAEEQLMFIFIVRAGGLYILPSTSLQNSCSNHLCTTPFPWEQRLAFPKYKIWSCSPQHCHGLISFAEFTSYRPRHFKIVVVNPATREFRELPKLDLAENMILLRSYVIFDQSSSSYKVIGLCHAKSHPGPNPEAPTKITKIIYVTNLVKDSVWRNAVIPNDDEEEHECWIFPSLHHGIPYRYYSKAVGGRVKIIVFDAEREDFRITFNFLHVSEFANIEALRTVVACKGAFYIFSSSLSSDKVLDVWVIKDYKMSNAWVKEASCDLKIIYEAASRYIEQFDYSTREITVQGVIGHRIIMTIKRTVVIPRVIVDFVLVIYDTINKSLQKYKVADEVLTTYMETSRVEHAEFDASLVSPNRG